MAKAKIIIDVDTDTGAWELDTNITDRDYIVSVLRVVIVKLNTLRTDSAVIATQNLIDGKEQ